MFQRRPNLAQPRAAKTPDVTFWYSMAPEMIKALVSSIPTDQRSQFSHLLLLPISLDENLFDDTVRETLRRARELVESMVQDASSEVCCYAMMFGLMDRLLSEMKSCFLGKLGFVDHPTLTRLRKVYEIWNILDRKVFIDSTEWKQIESARKIIAAYRETNSDYHMLFISEHTLSHEFDAVINTKGDCFRPSFESELDGMTAEGVGLPFVPEQPKGELVKSSIPTSKPLTEYADATLPEQ